MMSEGAKLNTNRPLYRKENFSFDFELFFHKSSLPVQVLHENRFVYANPATLKELGIKSLDEFPMENPAAISPELQPDGEHSHVKARRMLALARERGSVRFDWVHIRPDGSRFVSEVALTSVESDGEHFIFSSWTDLTERIELQQERRALEQRVEAATKTQAIAELAGGLAHDLNNFLQVILGYAQLGQHGATHASRDYLERVIESTNSARKLVSRMLRLGNAEESVLEDIELNEFLGEVEPLLRMLVGPGQTLTVHLPKALVHARAGRAALERVIMNLVSNASDAAEDDGAISITLREAKVDEGFRKKHHWAGRSEYAVITVEDNGIGMDRKTVRRIFEPFYSDKRRGGGTGLGLSNVLSTLSGFGGGVSVDSEPGTGTSFHSYLVPSDAANETPYLGDTVATTREQLECAGCTCIAIVYDRNEQVRELTRLALVEEKCQVVVPETDAEIRALFSRRRKLVGAIVLDTDEMLDAEGLVSYMRTNSRSPILLTGTHISPMLEELSERVPGCRFLLKPYDLDYLRLSLLELERELETDSLSRS